MARKASPYHRQGSLHVSRHLYQICRYQRQLARSGARGRVLPDERREYLHHRVLIALRVPSDPLHAVDPTQPNVAFVAAKLVSSLRETIGDLSLLIQSQRPVGEDEAHEQDRSPHELDGRYTNVISGLQQLLVERGSVPNKRYGHDNEEDGEAGDHGAAAQDSWRTHQ